MMQRIKAQTVAGLCCLLLLPALVHGQLLDVDNIDYEAELTAWGHPDIQGVWDRRTITPLQRPERLADKAFLTPEEIRSYERLSAERSDGRPLDSGRIILTVHDPDDLDYGTEVLPTGQTSLIVDPPDGRLPERSEVGQERAAARAREREGRGPADSYTDRSLLERCITWGVPGGMLPQPYNNNLLIVQTPDTVMIMNEMVHDVRIIPLDGRPHLPDTVRLWHGDSRGYWEGETLVIESSNFSEKTRFFGASENLELTERFTRVNGDILLYEFTVDDPTTWVRPWSISLPMIRTDQPLYEYACHEGNYAMRNMLSVAGNLEKQEREAARD